MRNIVHTQTKPFSWHKVRWEVNLEMVKVFLYDYVKRQNLNQFKSILK